MAADAWATALMVLGRSDGQGLARRIGLDALFVEREGDGLRLTPVGRLFGDQPCATDPQVSIA
jgi:FAD:protein FMN transferase